MSVDGRSDRFIKPGKTEKVTIKLRSTNRPGPFKRAISVTTNDPHNAKARITCMGRILAPFKGNLPTMNFGRIERDSGPRTKTITLDRGDGGPIKLEVIPTETPGIEAKVREMQPGERYELSVTLSPPWPNRRLQENLRVKTGLSELPEDVVRIHADTVPRLKPVPSAFNVPSPVRKAYKQSIHLVWDKTAPNKEVEVEVNDPDLSVSVEEKDGRQSIILEAGEGYRVSKSTTAVTVRTHDTVVPTLEIPVRASRKRARGDVHPAAAKQQALKRAARAGSPPAAAKKPEKTEP